MSDPAPITQFPVLDRDASQTFLQYLDPDTDKFTFQTFTDSNEKKKSYQINQRTRQIIDPLAKVLHGTLDEHWASLVDASRLGAGIFVTVNETTLYGRRTRENIVRVRAYFSDCDGVPAHEIKAGMAAIGLTPHMIVATSPGKGHLYWCVGGAALSAFSDTQKKLSDLFGSDPTICDLTQVMRLPGFPHQKDGSKGELVGLMHRHDGDDYPDAIVQEALARAFASLAPRRSLTERALEGLGKVSPDWSQGVDEGQRNTECARRAGAAIGEGAKFDEALEKCLRWNSLNRPPLNDEEVRSVVSSIWRTHARNQGLIVNGFMPRTDEPTPALKAVRGDELLSSPAPPRRWLVEGFIPAEETTMLSGDGGVGKTTIALQLAVAGISAETEWFGLKVAKSKFLYVSAEDPAGEIHFRLEEITKHLKIAKEELSRFKLVDLAGQNATIVVFDKSGQIEPTPLFEAIENAAREHGADCIILDAVADFFGGNENERREVRAFVSALRGLAMRLTAAVVFIAHPSVDGIRTGRGYSGSTHWNNAVRSRLYFTDAPADREGPPNPDLRMIELAKSNRARRGEKIYMMWDDGRFVAASQGAVENLTNQAEAERVFLDLLAKTNKQGIQVSFNRSSTFAPSVLAKMPAAKGIGKSALEGAMHRLIDKQAIRSEPFGPPSKVRHRLVVEPRQRNESQ